MHCQLLCIAKHVLYSCLRSTLKYRTLAYAPILHKYNTDVTDHQAFTPASAWHSCRDAALFPNYFGQTCFILWGQCYLLAFSYSLQFTTVLLLYCCILLWVGSINKQANKQMQMSFLLRPLQVDRGRITNSRPIVKVIIIKSVLGD